MASMSRFKMSQERLDAIKAELNYLETVREKEVAELIKEARKRMAEKYGKDKTIVTILADRAERYFSTALI